VGIGSAGGETLASAVNTNAFKSTRAVETSVITTAADSVPTATTPNVERPPRKLAPVPHSALGDLKRDGIVGKVDNTAPSGVNVHTLSSERTVGLAMFQRRY
jgi:hypothetical protein